MNSSKNIISITTNILSSEKQIMSNLVVPTSLVSRQDIDFGLSKNSLSQMANVTSYLNTNSMSNTNKSVNDSKVISDQIDTIARSMVKDTLPGEDGANISTPTFSMQSQKVNFNATKGLAKSCTGANVTLNSTITAPNFNNTESTMIFGSSNPSLYPSNSSSQMKTNIIRFTIFNTSGSEVSVKNLTDPIQICFDLKATVTNTTNSSQQNKLTCKYWDTVNNTWSTQGLTFYNQTADKICYLTIHLSDFAMLDSGSSSDLTAGSDHILWILYGMIAIFAALIFWSFYFDVADRRHSKTVQAINETEFNNKSENSVLEPEPTPVPLGFLAILFVIICFNK